MGVRYEPLLDQRRGGKLTYSSLGSLLNGVKYEPTHRDVRLYFDGEFNSFK